MSGRDGRSRRVGWAALLVAAASALLWPVGPGLLVTSDKAGFVDVLPVRPEEPFGLRYIHSVDLLPLEDWYVVRAGDIVQTETRLLSFGAGMGHIRGAGHGVEEGKWMRVVDMNRRIGTLHLRLGTTLSDFRLLYRGGEMPLSARWSHQRLSFRPIRLPFWAAAVFPFRAAIAGSVTAAEPESTTAGAPAHPQRPTGPHEPTAAKGADRSQ